jgi:hypothetical protein
MLEHKMGSTIIVGGHDHEPLDETLTSADGDPFDESIRIFKSGCEAQAVHLLDLSFDITDKPRLAQVDASLVEMSDFEPSSVVSYIVDSHMSLLTSLENEEIVAAGSYLPPGVVLSSIGSRYQQTSAGSLFCLAIKEELEVDVAMINGSSIKGNLDYPSQSMSYAELKQELPFPTKMVVIKMKRFELQNAIHFSRNQPDSDFERKGFLQVDLEFDRVGFHTGDQNDELMVALPRNLLKGFCQIEPLVEIGERLAKEGDVPGNEDNFVPAFDLVVRHYSKERWYEIVNDKLSFADLDVEQKGFISRHDVVRMLRQATGHEPPPFLIDDMFAVVDADENGIIDQGEFSHLLATLERESTTTFD